MDGAARDKIFFSLPTSESKSVHRRIQSCKSPCNPLADAVNVVSRCGRAPRKRQCNGGARAGGQKWSKGGGREERKKKEIRIRHQAWYYRSYFTPSTSASRFHASRVSPTTVPEHPSRDGANVSAVRSIYFTCLFQSRLITSASRYIAPMRIRARARAYVCVISRCAHARVIASDSIARDCTYVKSLSATKPINWFAICYITDCGLSNINVAGDKFDICRKFVVLCAFHMAFLTNQSPSFPRLSLSPRKLFSRLFSCLGLVRRAFLS